MTVNPWAAVLLALAVLSAGPPPTRRLLTATRRNFGILPVLAILVISAAVGVALPPSVTLVCAAAGIAILLRLRRRRLQRARRREGAALAAALEVLIGELKVGAHPMAAFGIAGRESSGSVGRALLAAGTRAQLGADVAEGIRATASSSAVPAYWNRLATFWQLAAEHGLAMSVLMRQAHRDIIDRQRFADRMHAALAGARSTAAILALLPALGVLLGQLIGANPIAFLFGGGPGGLLLCCGLTLICLGVWWADRIVERFLP